MNETKPNILFSLLSTAILYFMIVYVPHGLRVFTRSITGIEHLNDTISIGLMLVSYAIIFTFFYFYLRLMNKNDSEMFLLEKGNIKENSLITFAIAITGLLLIMILTIIIAQILIPSLAANANTVGDKGRIIDTSTNNFWLEVYLYPIIIAPVLEEILHRGINHSFFKADGIFNIRSILYILTSSFVFGFIHYSGPIGLAQEITSIMNPFILGIVFSVIYLKTKNIAYPIIAHILYNIYVTVIS